MPFNRLLRTALSHAAASGVALTVLVTAAAAVYFPLAYAPRHRRQVLEELEQELLIRAEQRHLGLELWARERFADTRNLAESPRVRGLLTSGGGDAALRLEVHEVIARIKRAYGYDRVHLLDRRQRVVLATDSGPLARGDLRLLTEVDTTGQPQTTFHRHPMSGKVYVSFSTPVWGPREERLGTIMVHVDPAEWVYPFLSAAPLPTPTAEATLIEWRGDSVVWVSPLKKDTIALLTRRTPLPPAERTLKGFADAAGAQGDFRAFTDYHGDRVLGVRRMVANTPWLVTVKVDEAAALAPINRSLRRAALSWAVLLLGLNLTALAFLRGARRATQQAVESGRARFAAGLDNANDAILFIDGEGRIRDCNKRAVELYGGGERGPVGRLVADIDLTRDPAAVEARMAQLHRTGRAIFETQHRAADGTIVPVEVSATVVDIDGERIIIGANRDIRERKAAEERITRLNVILKTLSEINQLIVRETDPDHLLAEGCRILVEHGGFRTAWVGVPEPDFRVRPATASGNEDGYVTSVTIRWDDTAEGCGAVGTCVKERRTVVGDYVGGPAQAPWREAALARGMRSVAATPILKGSALAGILVVHSALEGVFDAELVALMEELASDLGFAMMTIDERAARARAEEAQRRNAAQVQAILDNTSAPMVALTRDGVVALWNPASERLFGYTAEEVVGKPYPLVPAERIDEFRGILARALAGTPDRGRETQRRRKDGRLVDVLLTTAVLPDPEGGPDRVIGTFTDLTELRAGEERHRALFAEASEAIIVADAATGLTVEANRAAQLLTGRSAEDFERGLGVLDFIASEDHERALQEFRSAAAEGVRNAPLTVLHTDGRRIPVEVSTAKVADPAGRLLLVGTFKNVQERVAAQRAVQENQARFQTVVESIPEGIIMVQGDTVVYANPTALRTFRAEQPEQFVGTNFLDRIPPDELRPAAERAQRVRDERGAVPMHEATWLRLDGTPFPTEASSVPFTFQGQAYSLAFFRDITERRRAAERLRESEDRMRLAIETTRMGIWEWNLRTNRIRWDVEMFRLYGLPPTDDGVVSYADWSSSLDAGELARQEAILQEMIARRGRSQREFAIRRRDTGETRHIYAVEATRLGPSGEAEWVVGTNIDVTERKEAEAERLRLAAAVEQSSDIVVITDIDGTIQYVNPAFERVTGYTRAEAIGQNPRVLKSGRHSQEDYKRLWDTVLAGRPFSGTLTNRKKNGDLYIAEIAISPLRDEGGEVVQFVAIQRDVSHERDLEAMLRQSQKMEAMGQLTGGIAHDFNNFLNVILMNQALARDELPPEMVEVRGYLADVEKAALRGTGMVRKLLAFSRNQQLEPTALDLREALLELERTLGRLLPATLTLRVEAGDAARMVMADPGALEQMVMNLANNARDAMPKGGTLTLGLRELDVRDDDDLVASGVGSPGRYACISVTDSGEGMDEYTLSRVFEPFFTTKPAGLGTGLGLPMIFGLMKQHGGYVRIYSEVGKGTTVRLYFPAMALAAPVAAMAGAAERPATATPHGTETILLVEDQDALRRSAARALGKLGYEVLAAADGLEALQMLAGNRDRVKLVLSDLVMPNMGGAELATRLLADEPQVKILMMSGYASGASAEVPVGLPHIQKPWTVEAISRKVRDVLDGTGG